MRTAKIGPDLRLLPDTKVGQTGEKISVFKQKISCLPASPRLFEHLKNGIIAYF